MPNRETVRLDKSLLAAQSFRSRHTFRRRLLELCLGAPQVCRHAEVQAAKSNATEVLQVGRLLAWCGLWGLRLGLTGLGLDLMLPCHSAACSVACSQAGPVLGCKR